MSTSTPAPTTMRGAYLPGDSTAVLRDDVPLREPAHRELLLKVGASGLCGSDIGFIYREHKTHSGIKDGSPAYKGVVCGHEPAGEVVAVGPGRWHEGQFLKPSCAPGDMLLYDCSHSTLAVTIRGEKFTLVASTQEALVYRRALDAA